MAFETLLVEDDGPVREIALNRSQVLNALNRKLRAELQQALDEAEADEGVRVVVLTGVGRAFSVGVDLKESALRDESQDLPANVHRRMRAHAMETMRVWELEKPVVAAVNGYALGAGCDLALCCDIAIASDQAQLGEPEIRHVSSPPTLMMPWLVGPRVAKELLLTGDTVDAARAERLGLVNRVVPHERLRDEAHALARRIAEVPPVAVRLNKLAINRTFELMGLYNALNYNAELSTLIHVADPEATAERRRLIREQGMKGFLTHRDKREGAGA